jgi:hypothetical protein
MKQYIGTKIIQAEEGVDPKTGEIGYKVVYKDGYTSWSPKSAFEEAYRLTDGLTFGLALEALKKGHKVSRKGWNGKGMWLSLSGSLDGTLIEAEKFWSKNNMDFAIENGGKALVLPAITMKTVNAQGRVGILMGWLASQTDMLSDDWEIVE